MNDAADNSSQIRFRLGFTSRDVPFLLSWESRLFAIPVSPGKFSVLGFLTFSTVNEVKPISRDPEKSREMTLYFMNFPGNVKAYFR
jgi:hypothetical protein